RFSEPSPAILEELMTILSKLGGVGLILLAASAVACSGSDGKDGTSGTNGKDGQSGPTSFHLIEPRFAVIDREIDVTISVQGVELKATPKVDFGDAKITVSSVK